MERKRKAVFSRPCVLCRQWFKHDGYGVWTELRLRLFDKDGRHVIGVEEKPMEGDRGFFSDGAVCIYCLRNLGVPVAT